MYLLFLGMHPQHALCSRARAADHTGTLDYAMNETASLKPLTCDSLPAAFVS